jgi:hypothetical protein
VCFLTQGLAVDTDNCVLLDMYAIPTVMSFMLLPTDYNSTVPPCGRLHLSLSLKMEHSVPAVDLLGFQDLIFPYLRSALPASSPREQPMGPESSEAQIYL